MPQETGFGFCTARGASGRLGLGWRSAARGSCTSLERPGLVPGVSAVCWPGWQLRALRLHVFAVVFASFALGWCLQECAAHRHRLDGFFLSVIHVTEG